MQTQAIIAESPGAVAWMDLPDDIIERIIVIPLGMKSIYTSLRLRSICTGLINPVLEPAHLFVAKDVPGIYDGIILSTLNENQRGARAWLQFTKSPHFQSYQARWKEMWSPSTVPTKLNTREGYFDEFMGVVYSMLSDFERTFLSKEVKIGDWEFFPHILAPHFERVIVPSYEEMRMLEQWYTLPHFANVHTVDFSGSGITTERCVEIFETNCFPHLKHLDVSFCLEEPYKEIELETLLACTAISHKLVSLTMNWEWEPRDSPWRPIDWPLYILQSCETLKKLFDADPCILGNLQTLHLCRSYYMKDYTCDICDVVAILYYRTPANLVITGPMYNDLFRAVFVDPAHAFFEEDDIPRGVVSGDVRALTLESGGLDLSLPAFDCIETLACDKLAICFARNFPCLRLVDLRRHTFDVRNLRETILSICAMEYTHPVRIYVFAKH
eukprot:4125142-Pleurochrysis_carterae.AAC.1